MAAPAAPNTRDLASTARDVSLALKNSLKALRGSSRDELIANSGALEQAYGNLADCATDLEFSLRMLF